MANIIDVQAPNLGQSGMDITIRSWLKGIGDHVEKGEPLYELSNEKLTQEIESPATGTLVKILIEEGSVVAVGAVIGQIEAG